jgi:hypothetical protein
MCPRRLVCLLIVVGVAELFAGPARAGDTGDETAGSPAEVETIERPVVATPGFHFRHSFVFQGTFNSDDASVGVTYRFFVIPDLGLAAFGSISGRFWDEVVRVPFRPGTQLQVRETRELFAFGVHESVPLTGGFGGFLDAGAGYTAANYDGVSLDPEEGWTPLIRAGATLQFRPWSTLETAIRLEIGYRYADLRSVPSNWLYVGLGFLR